MSKKETTIYLKTPLGTCRISGKESGITGLSITEDKHPVTMDIPDSLMPAAKQLKAYFAGKRTLFDLSLSSAGTDFQQRVWRAVAGIPYGKTMSYRQLACTLGSPGAVRAVAAANAKNPIWILIPCHRVIGSNGNLTGYAGGLWRKRYLLEHEGFLQKLPELFP